jgi:hypothetical protein
MKATIFISTPHLRGANDVVEECVRRLDLRRGRERGPPVALDCGAKVYSGY